MSCKCCCYRCTHIAVKDSRCCKCVPQFLCLTVGNESDPPMAQYGSPYGPFCLWRNKAVWNAEYKQYIGTVPFNSIGITVTLRLIDDGYDCYWEGTVSYPTAYGGGPGGATIEGREETFEPPGACDDFEFTIPIDLGEYTQKGAVLERLNCCGISEIRVTTYYAHRLPWKKCTEDSPSVYHCSKCGCLPRKLCLTRYAGPLLIGRYVLESTDVGVWEHDGFRLELVEEDGVCCLLWPDGLTDTIPSQNCFGWEITHTMYGTTSVYIVNDMNCCVQKTNSGPDPCTPIRCQPPLSATHVLLSQIYPVDMEDYSAINIEGTDGCVNWPEPCEAVTLGMMTFFQRCVGGGTGTLWPWYCPPGTESPGGGTDLRNANLGIRWNVDGCDPTYYAYYNSNWPSNAIIPAEFGIPTVEPPAACGNHLEQILWYINMPTTPVLPIWCQGEAGDAFELQMTVEQEYFVHDVCIELDKLSYDLSELPVTVPIYPRPGSGL